MLQYAYHGMQALLLEVLERIYDLSFPSSASVRNATAVNIKFAVEQATKTQRGVEEELCSFLNLGARWWSTPRLGHFTPGKDPIPIA
jgi:hypothetical protein